MRNVSVNMMLKETCPNGAWLRKSKDKKYDDEGLHNYFTVGLLLNEGLELYNLSDKVQRASPARGKLLDYIQHVPSRCHKRVASRDSALIDGLHRARMCCKSLKLSD